MTLDELDKDMAIAAVLAFKASTPDRRLAGAEWLHQLAGQLVEALKDERFKPLGEAFDAAVRDDGEPEQPAEETPEPEKARYFKEGRYIWKMPPSGVGQMRGVEEKVWSSSIWTISDMNSPRVKEITAEEGEPEKARYFYNGEPDYLRKIENGELYAWGKIIGREWFENKSLSVAEVLERHREITHEEAIKITGEP